MSVSRILVTPRWAGTLESDWYPWIAGRVPAIERVPLPAPDAPTIAGCVAAFGAALAAGDPSTTLVVGHSVSVQGWLHTLAAAETPVAGMLAVAGWWSIDRPWPSIQPWIDGAPDAARARARLGRIHVLLGTDDPFTADQDANAALFRERLGAEVTLVPGAAHFNRPEEPAVLDALLSLRTAS